MWMKKKEYWQVADEKEVISEEKKKKAKNLRKWIFRVLGVIALILLLLLLLHQCKGGNSGNPDIVDKAIGFVFDKESSNIVPDESKQAAQDRVNEKVAKSYLTMNMNTNPVFADGKSKGNLNIINEETNRYAVIVEIYRMDTKELIYKSGGVAVGNKIEKAALNVDLPMGKYDCVAVIGQVI